MHQLLIKMLLDMVPPRVVHHRLVILRRLTRLFRRNHTYKCKDKGTWKCRCVLIVYTINVGETVYERN